MSFQSTSLKSRAFLMIPLLTTGALIGTGCNSSSSGSAATSDPGTRSSLSSGSATGTSATPTPNVTATPTPTPTPTATASAPQVGETCTGDSNKTCLALHFVSYRNSAGTPTATTAQAATIIHTMNQLFSPCAVGFQIEKYETVDPTKSGLSYGAQSQNETDEIRKTYGDDNRLLAVTTGPWGTSVNAWTNMPGDQVFGAIMEASIVTYGDGIIYAHEFGHYLGLDHVSDNSNLMSPVIYTTSTDLTNSQCQTAKDTADHYWSKMVRM